MYRIGGEFLVKKKISLSIQGKIISNTPMTWNSLNMFECSDVIANCPKRYIT